ncbi:MAG: hypothetical protein M1819_000251 [Sarea resinae]|nr:MAG: hypothetical protein M1819_000251 [Sarea resinae]
MPSGSPETPGEDFFNDLSQQGNSRRVGDAPGSPNGYSSGSGRRGSKDDAPRPKRIACIVCRKRKLRCDGQKPSCGTCTRLSHDCAYDEVRKKSGPKRGYVKALEARLAQVETLLKAADPDDASAGNEGVSYPNAIHHENQQSNILAAPDFMNIAIGKHNRTGPMDRLTEHYNQAARQQPVPEMPIPNPLPDDVLTLGMEGDFSWELIGLGLDEPLPSPEVIDDLHQIYFEKIHPSMPMIHRPRYLAALNLSPQYRPPVCLRYAMWCLAASVSEQYIGLQEHFYQRARKYIELDELKGHGESTISIAHCQTWTVIGIYEFKVMYFPRAWMSTGRACRLAQMMGLHRLDGEGLDVKQTLPPSKDWTELEERRRTFWMSFCSDRYASVGTGWPMTVEEKDILTKLPASEEAFLNGKPSPTVSLAEALDSSGATTLSPLAAVVLLACLFGRNLHHLHRPDENENPADLSGGFWKRHRGMENILLNTSLSLPDHLRLPAGINDPNVIFLNMSIHTSTICLHQAAIFKADKNRLPSSISAESKIRCITAAAEIVSIMKMISHLDLSAMNPFISFCLYVAARVFVQYLKSRPGDDHVGSSLQFLLSAMHAIKRKNPLTTSFLAQIDVDLEGLGMDDPRRNSSFSFGLKKGVAEVGPDKRPECLGGLVDVPCPLSKAADKPPFSDCVAGMPPSMSNAENVEIQTTADPALQNQSSWFVSEQQQIPTRSRPEEYFVPSTHRSTGIFAGQGNIFASENNHNGHSTIIDMDTSPDGGHTSTSVSEQPTPSGSGSSRNGSGGGHANSSHTSNTSPQLSESATTTTSPSKNPSLSSYSEHAHVNALGNQHRQKPQRQQQQQFFMSPVVGSTNKELDAATAAVAAANNEANINNPFIVPPGWGVGDLGSTGLTPMSDAAWGQILEPGVNWDVQDLGEGDGSDRQM